MLLQGLTKIIVKFRAEKVLYIFVSCTKHPLEGKKKWYAQKRLCSNTLERN